MNNGWDDAVLAEKLKNNPDLKIHPDSIHKRIGCDSDRVTSETGCLPLKKLSRAHPEQDFQQEVIDLLHDNGYKVCAFGKARLLKGGKDVYRSPFQADGKGFKDLVAAKAGRPLLLIELKTESGKLSPEQEDWHEVLLQVPGVLSLVVRPSEIDRLKEVV